MSFGNRLKKLEDCKPSIFPLIVDPLGRRFRVKAPQSLAGRIVTRKWIDASGADPVIIDDIPDSEDEKERG